MKKQLHKTQTSEFVLIKSIVRNLFMVCFCLFGFSMMGQTSIWTNPITGTNPSAANPYTTGDVKNANITVSGIGRGTLLSSNNTNNIYDTSGWTISTLIDLNGYFNFTLTPASGYKVSMNDFTYATTSGTRPPTSFAFRSNANSDNFTTNIGTPNVGGTTLSLTGSAYQNLTTATTFRLYGWNRANGSDGTWAINDFTFTGSVLGSATTALSFGAINTYGSAPVQTFQVNGNGLNPTNATITINGSTNYEVSTTSASSGFGSSATLTAASGNLSAANVWVRLKATSAVGTYNENITFGGGGVTGITIACSGTVTTAPLTITGVTANNKSYNGLTTATLSGTAAYSGLQNGETFSVTGTASASFATATVGTAKAVTVTGYTTPSSNYTVSQPTGLTADITTVNLTITGVTADNKSYDGLTTATLSGTPAYNGLQNGETFSVTGTASASFATATVGTTKAVTVTGYTAPSANYTVSQPTGLTADITTVNLTITANDGSKTYGQTFTTGSGSTAFTSSGLQNSETIGSITIASTGAVNTAVVNTYFIVPTAAIGGTFTASNYSITYDDGTLTVSQASLIITANNGSKTYGQTHTVGSGSTAFTSSGLQNSETIGSITIASTGAANTAAVNTYSIVPTAATGGTFTASNYSITYTNGTLTVNQASLTITANNGSKTYGQTHTVGSGSTAFTSSGLQNSETIGSITIASTGAVNTASVNAYTIVPSAATGGTFTASNYNITYTNGTLTVGQASLTITANNSNKTYGTIQGSPQMGATTFGSTGLQNSETIGSVTLTYGLGAIAATDVVGSTSTITPSAATGGTFTASNYSISYTSNSGTLTVTTAPLIITADNGSKTYGQVYTVGSGSTAFTSSGLQNSETIGSITISSTGAANTAAVNTYSIVPSVVTGGTFTAANYAITYINGTLTVNQANLTITANDGSKTYGQTFTTGSGSTAFTSSGLQNSETIASITIFSAGAGNTAAVNAYSIVPSAATGGTFTASNYNITYTNGTLTVGQANLTITADNGSKTYGQAYTVGSGSTAFTSSGLQNSETIGSITISSPGAVNTAAVNTYPIIPTAGTGGTFTASNYAISYIDGILTVNQANLTITANSGSKTYGQTFITGSNSTAFTSSGLQNSETIGSITIASTGAANTSAVNTYSIVPSTVTGGTFIASNYTISYIDGILTVNPVNLTIIGITANNKSYDGLTTATLSGTPAYSGLQNGETFSVTGTPSASFANPIVGTAKSVTVTGYTAPNSNYTVSQPTGLNADITTANLTIIGITANNKSYDSLTTATLSGTANYSGLQNGETFTVIGTPLASFGSAAADIAKAVTVSGYLTPNSNYTLSQPTGLTADIITANPTSATASPSTLCIGASATLNLIGGGGDGTALVKWYTNSCGTTVVGTGNGLSVSPTITTTYYGRYEGIFTTACASVTVTVNPTSLVGTVSANQSICTGSLVSSNITISSATGTIQWQRADNTGFTIGLTNIGTDATTLTIAQVGALTATSYFRAVVTSGVCPAVTSSTVTVTVNSQPVGPVITKDPDVTTVCSGMPLTITVSTAGTGGAVSSQDEYRFSTNNGTTWSSWGTSLPYFTGVVGTNRVESRRTSTGFGCTTAMGNTVSWAVNALPVSGTLSPTGVQAAVCAGTLVSATATSGSGGGGTIVDELEVSLSGGAYSSYTSGVAINTSGQTSVSIRTRRTATANGCTSSAYNTVSWIVNPLPTADAGANRTIYRGDSTTIGNTAIPSNTYSWVSNPTGFTSAISNPSVSPLVNTTYTVTETTPQGCIKSNSVIVSVKDNLIISKSLISASPTKPGDVVTYQISYQNLNNGGIAAQNITITDLLPSSAFFTYTSSSPTGTFNAGLNTLTHSISSLAAGASGAITVSGTVGVLGSTYSYDGTSYYISSGSSTQTITNSASIENALTPLIASNVVSNAITQNCGLSMPATLSGKVHTSTGSNVYYFIEVQNTGNITDRFSLSNTIPVQTGDVPLTSIITNMAGDAISQTPWLSPGQKYGFLVQFTTPGGTPPDKYNYTSIKATSTVCTTSATTYIDTYVYNGQQPTGCDLLISKTASSGSIIAGANITYTIVVRNLSNNKAKDLVIDDVLPANLNYISSSQTGGDNINYNTTTRLIRVTKAGNYDNGNADIVITIIAQTTCSSVPSVINSATVDNSNLDNNVFNNESSVTVTVLPNVSDPIPTSTIICSGSGTTITLPSLGANRNYKWYSAATGGTLLQTNGNSYVTGALTSSTTYYVSQYNTLDSTCESNRIAMLVTVVSPPVIIAQPIDINYCGTAISFTYNVSGTFLTQQWQISTNGGTTWTNLANTGVYSGVTNQTLSISNMVGLNGYKYRCILNSFSCYTLTSNTASIIDLPTITGTLSVCKGLTTTLTGSGIADSTNPWTSASPTVATVNNSGVVTGVAAGTSLITYKTNTNCTITALVTVNDLPVITGTLTICAGFTTTLSGSGTPDSTNPWTSASTSVATVSNTGVVIGVSAGTSIITYKNSNGCIITATVTVNALPIITTQPINQLDCEGASVNFTAVASGTGLTYTWQRKKPTDASFITIPIEGNVSYPSAGKIKIDNVGSSQSPSGTQYQVVITNSSGCSITSGIATLSVNEITGISPIGTNVTQCYGTNYSYTVSTSYPANVVSYQWKSSIASGPWNDVVDGARFSGATTATLNITNGTPAESAEYRVYITFTSSGANCNVNSSSRTRMITFLPLLTTPATSITQPSCATATGTIAVTVQSVSDTYSFDNGISYQPSAVKSGLTPGNYTVIIKNSQNCISPSSTVTINAQPLTPVQPVLSIVTAATCSKDGSFTITNYNSTYTYSVSPNTGVVISGNTVTAPTGSYTVIATLGTCSSIASSSRTIAPLITNTWSVSGWSTGTAPTMNSLVIIDFDYNSSTNGNLNACSLTINPGKKLTITANNYAIIQNDLTVNGILDVLDKGSLVMVNDAGTVTNNGTTTVRRFTSPFEKFDYVYWSTPVASTFIPTTFPTWRTNYAFEFLPANFLDANNDSFDDDGNDWSYASTMLPGKGYIVMTPTNKAMYPSVEEIVFSGKVNNGVVTTPINLTPNAASDDDFNLIGNPYPSAISADAFINANISTNSGSYSTIDGTLYFWTHVGDISNTNIGPDGYNFSSDDYAVYNLSGGVQAGLGGAIPSGFIASGQGFFVEADKAGTLLFNNAMRVGTETKNNQFYRTALGKTQSKTATTKDRIWLNLENSSKMFSQQLIGYFDNATLGFDKGYDGPFSDAGNYVNFYSFIDDDAFKIQGRSSFDENDQVRLGYFSAVAGTFNISIDSKEGVFANANQAVFLEDKVTNSLFDLKNGNYTFTTEKGTFNNRFVLRYTDKTLGLDEINKYEDIIVLYSNNYKTVIIKNNSDAILNSVSLFNIAGQNITHWDVKDIAQTTLQIPIKNLTSGVYVVKINTNKGEISKKIIVK